MSKYLLAIYRKELSDELLAQIGGLFSDADIEKANERMSHFIGAGFERKYDSQKDYHCYRIMAEQIVPALFFLEPRPLYVGTFNETEEQKCALMTAHCRGVAGLIESNIGQGLNMEPYFKATFDQDSNLNIPAIENCVKALKKKLRLAKSIQKKYFQDRIVTHIAGDHASASVQS